MKLSLAKQFTGLLAIFVTITVLVLVLLMKAHQANLGFATQEMLGNTYQRPVEKVLQEVMIHRVYAQRALYGEKASQDKLSGLQQSVDSALKEMASAEVTIKDDLQFTPEGLEKRQRQAASAHAIMEKWNSLKGEVSGLKPDESNTKHQEIIAALRMAIGQLGDTSNLVLDPDLDSYYLMDITLLALPQTQDRIQSAIIEFEPIVRRKTATTEEQIRASVVAALMRESDSDRLKADFQTVLNWTHL
jgi:methyl-accepting chemotaxis protein